jgi:hypothetical protein
LTGGAARLSGPRVLVNGDIGRGDGSEKKKKNDGGHTKHRRSFGAAAWHSVYQDALAGVPDSFIKQIVDPDGRLRQWTH